LDDDGQIGLVETTGSALSKPDFFVTMQVINPVPPMKTISYPRLSGAFRLTTFFTLYPWKPFYFISDLYQKFLEPISKIPMGGNGDDFAL
jgi:hypothetical protein